MTLPVLRRLARREFVQHVWRAARDPDTPLGQPCPSCLRPAREVPGTAPVLLDVCPRCQMVWFDAMELDTVPRPPQEVATEKPKSAEAAKALVELELQHSHRMRRYERTERSASDPPDEIWKYLPGLLGLPVEFDGTTQRERPWATWGLVALIAIVSVIAFKNIGEIAQAWGFIAATPLLHGGLNVVTSFFLHAGWMHLLGNLYFLWVFGDDVEGLVGPKRFLLLIAASALLGDVLHMMFGPAEIPAIGSSGGISGVLAFYALAFPRARLGLLFYFVFWIRVPAWGYMVFWVALQLLGVAAGGGSVAYAAHLGGALAGAALWFAWRPGLLQEDYASSTSRTR